MPHPLTSQVHAGCLSWGNIDRVLHLHVQGHLTMAKSHRWSSCHALLIASRCLGVNLSYSPLGFHVSHVLDTSMCRTSHTSWKQCSPQRGVPGYSPEGGTRILSLSWFNSLWCGHWNALSSLVWSYFGSFPFLPALGENSCSWETDISVDQDTCTI